MQIIMQIDINLLAGYRFPCQYFALTDTQNYVSKDGKRHERTLLIQIKKEKS